MDVYSYWEPTHVYEEIYAMNKKYTLKIIKIQLREISPNLRILAETYTNPRVPLQYKCLVCKHTSQNCWENLRRGKGCRKCGYKRAGDIQRFSLQDIEKKLQTISPKIEILSRKYINNVTPLRCQCRSCGYDWKPTWHDLAMGQGCPVCSNRIKHTLPKIRRMLKNINQSILLPHQKYQGALKPLKCKCRTCDHTWSAPWSNLQRDHGCPKCTNIQSGLVRRQSIHQVRCKIAKANPNTKVISEIYDPFQPLKCECRECGYQWETMYDNLLSRTGCYGCERARKLDRLRNRLPKSIETFSDYRPSMEFKCTECSHTWSSSPYTNQVCRQCHPHSVWTQEEEVREIIERLTGWKFPKIKKSTSPIEMELDGYNAEHQIAFERQGEYHYRPHWSYASKPATLGEAALHSQKLRDDKKRLRCRRVGILLIRVPYFKRDPEAFIRKKLNNIN